MDILKKVFPLSFKRTDSVANLVIGIIIYLLAGIVASAVIVLATMITGWVPVLGALIGWVLGVVGSLVGLSVLVGIVLQIRAFAKVLKD